MFLRRALIRLLLLAVCFHTVVGLPAHEASHIQQRVARAAAALADGARGPVPGSVATALGVPAAFFFDAEARPGLLDAVDGEADVPATGGGHGGAALDTLCAWCAAFGQLASALASPPPAPLATADAAGPAFPRPAAAFVPRPERWRFASRDPPRAPADRPSSSPPSS
ncbi:DUF2946 family protein [Variovorax sp. PvP013]|uniref:DUF2946 family protein n=1 Tax=Variovorax sp. PvP013 TaxID=3156435 RepID=UPI003D1E4DB5